MLGRMQSGSRTSREVRECRELSEKTVWQLCLHASTADLYGEFVHWRRRRTFDIFSSLTTVVARATRHVRVPTLFNVSHGLTMLKISIAMGDRMTAFATNRRSEATRALALGLFFAVSGCLTPPALPSAGIRGFDARRSGYPNAVESVELPVAKGTFLRGVFLRGQPGSPVVLHLLGARGSISTDLPSHDDSGPDPRGRLRVPWSLLEAGFSSLIIDYEGIGGSDGRRDVRNLRRDVLAMWTEAIRRAGGSEDRVVVRASSLGCISASLLLKQGARPSALVMIAPVRPDTIVRHRTAQVYGDFAGRFSQLLFRSVADVDFLRVIEEAHVPTLVFANPQDELMPAHEQDALKEVVHSINGTWLVAIPDRFSGPETTPCPQHAATTELGRSLVPTELGFLHKALLHQE